MNKVITLHYNGRTGQFFRPNGWETFYANRPSRHWPEYRAGKMETPTYGCAAPPSDDSVYRVELEMIHWCNVNFLNRWFISWHPLGMTNHWHFQDTNDAILFKTTWNGASYE